MTLPAGTQHEHGLACPAFPVYRLIAGQGCSSRYKNAAGIFMTGVKASLDQLFP